MSPKRVVRNFWSVPVAVIALAVALTGCGGGQPEAEVSTPSTQTSAPSSPSATPSVTPTPTPSGPSDSERSAQLDAAIRSSLGVAEYTELLSDPSLWGGYVSDVRVVGSNAFITLQVASDDPSRDALGEQAAQALSTLLPAEAVTDIGFLVVQDASGVVIDQQQPQPF